jgi:hypothetical protein
VDRWSRPSRACGSKRLDRDAVARDLDVTPVAGVRIETCAVSRRSTV